MDVPVLIRVGLNSGAEWMARVVNAGPFSKEVASPVVKIQSFFHCFFPAGSQGPIVPILDMGIHCPVCERCVLSGYGYNRRVIYSNPLGFANLY